MSVVRSQIERGPFDAVTKRTNILRAASTAQTDTGWARSCKADVGRRIVTKTTDTNKATVADKATDADKRREHKDALRDDELDSVSGGDLYIHQPRGWSRRIDQP
jgi:hypothetical protein